MVESGLSLSDSSLQEAEFNRVKLDTPLIWLPGMSEEEFSHEFGLMMQRSRMTEIFLSGGMDSDSFLDFLDEQGQDVLGISVDCWNLCY